MTSSSQAIEEESRIIYEVGFKPGDALCCHYVIGAWESVFVFIFNLVLSSFAKSITFNYIATLGIKQMLYNLDVLSTEALT